jgi:hypothetical protein
VRSIRSQGAKESISLSAACIAGNAHTPGYVAWLGRLIPGPFGTIEQDDIGRAFVAEFIGSPASNGGRVFR